MPRGGKNGGDQQKHRNHQEFLHGNERDNRRAADISYGYLRSATNGNRYADRAIRFANCLNPFKVYS